jgi:hypothetical protein
MTHSICHRVDKNPVSEGTKFSSLVNVTFCNLRHKLGSLCVCVCKGAPVCKALLPEAPVKVEMLKAMVVLLLVPVLLLLL